LGSAGGIHPGRLDVAVRVRADPDIRPRRGDRERVDPLAQLGADGLAVEIAIGETLAGTHPAETCRG
jgi:hypothetical protein